MMKTICEMIAVMQEAADGKPIEARRAELPGGKAGWIQVANPSWNWKLYDYRVQPADPSPGQIAWESYCHAAAEADCVSLQDWDALPHNVQERWHAVAKACREAKP